MSPIRLIRNTAQLSGTCYFEFLPGPYLNKCWNDGSVFLAEDVFELVEPIIVRHEPRFDHYTFVVIPRPTWEHITADLDQLSCESDRPEVAALACELATWLRKQLVEHDCVSVLGM